MAIDPIFICDAYKEKFDQVPQTVQVVSMSENVARIEYLHRKLSFIQNMVKKRN